MTVNAAFRASLLQKFVDLCAPSELSLMVNTEAFCLPSRQPHMIQNKLLYADLHGALSRFRYLAYEPTVPQTPTASLSSVALCHRARHTLVTWTFPDHQR